MEDRFKFFIPNVDLIKASDGKGGEKLVVKGIASTTEKDTDGEYLDPSGFDLSYFKNAGFINWNHQAKNDPSAIIGEPLPNTKITTKNEFYIEAELYADSQKAKDTYDLAATLSKSSNTRKLGWSIEGKALERDPLNPKKIKRAMITSVAITPSPKNGGTWLDILKGNDIDEEYIYEVEKAEQGNVLEENPYKANGGVFYLIDITKPNGDRITVDKDFNITILSKALSTTSGAALKREDLEKELKYPREVVKAIVTVTSAVEQGIIDKDIFEKSIKPQILDKLDLNKK